MNKTSIIKIDTSKSIGLIHRFMNNCEYGAFREPISTKFEIYNCCKCNEKTLLIYKGRLYCYKCLCKRYVIDKLLDKMRGKNGNNV